MDSISIFAVDVGNPKNFAWASNGGLQGEDGDGLASAITSEFITGRRVALGFECPLFIPVPHHWADIGKARVGEGDRSWSAGAGATVTTYGLHEVAWILAHLREAGNAKKPIFFSPEAWLSSTEPGLLLWEAFVTGAGKGRDHNDDAQRACRAFLQLMKRKVWNEARQVKVGNKAQSLNLAALAAEWAGWPIAATEHKSQLLVVKPAKI
jgi:hypothetical protein